MHIKTKPAAFIPVLLATCLTVNADETVDLVCKFQYGELQVHVNYTKGKVNGATAIVTDKEITWTPKGGSQGLAIINRYSGIMEISKGTKAYRGMCSRKAGK